jgi:hypothetical protein
MLWKASCAAGIYSQCSLRYCDFLFFVHVPWEFPLSRPRMVSFAGVRSVNARVVDLLSLHYRVFRQERSRGA